MGEDASTTHPPVTYDHSAHVTGPPYYGTRTALAVGVELIPGHGSNGHAGRGSNRIHFSALVDTAAWGAELATALTGSGHRGHSYVVEPLGPFQDDPNHTNKWFPGNLTQSCRTRHPAGILAEVDDWLGHDPGELNTMLEHLARLRDQGLDARDD